MDKDHPDFELWCETVEPQSAQDVRMMAKYFFSKRDNRSLGGFSKSNDGGSTKRELIKYTSQIDIDLCDNKDTY